MPKAPTRHSKCLADKLEQYRQPSKPVQEPKVAHPQRPLSEYFGTYTSATGAVWHWRNETVSHKINALLDLAASATDEDTAADYEYQARLVRETARLERFEEVQKSSESRFRRPSWFTGALDLWLEQWRAAAEQEMLDLISWDTYDFNENFDYYQIHCPACYETLIHPADMPLCHDHRGYFCSEACLNS